ncbi:MULTISPECIES: dermonecrotic toxin domain-containing protein [unclassified Pseudomonas]|uniref:dermonecrotic toxin domain-containing protein n=1 Tax=unclassified Pseudomonas TaxID=196821 RepID=UPI0035C2470A
MSAPTSQSTSQEHLQHLARALVADCPDMRQMARDTAGTVLARLGHATLDPDQVFLNRFHTAQSSPRTFSGWEHYERPYQSLTLPQLVMQRFDVNEQDNADLLGYLTGFYQQNASHDVFDERNEVDLAPSDVLHAFWEIDFATAFKAKLEHFWATRTDDYRTLAKANFLAKVLETYANHDDRTLAIHARLVAQALTGRVDLPPTLEQLRQDHTPASGYRLCTFDIGGHVASDILRVELPGGGQLLYLPGEVEALHYFADRKALYWWVLGNTNQAENRARFMTHFPLASHAERDSDVGLNHMIDLLFFNWGGHDHDALNQLDTTLEVDAFTYLCDSMRQRMRADADFALRSNADLRKQLWIGYLKAFGQVFGAMAAVDWPVALAVVGAGLAETGLNIDQAVNGHTTAERQAGVTGALIAAINTLFNATLLVGAGANAAMEFSEEGELLTEPAQQEPIDTQEEQPATPAELEAWVPEPLRPVQPEQVLKAFETNEILTGEPGEGPLAGIYTQGGKFYALVDDTPYQVRYVGEMRTWVVVDPESPYSFYRNVPLRRSSQGLWQPVQPTGLRGGGLPRKALKIWGRVTGRVAAQPVAEPVTPYELPEHMRATLRRETLTPDNRGLSGVYGSTDAVLDAAFGEFRRLRDALASDAQAFFAAPELPPRPLIPALPEGAGPTQLIEAVYQHSEGLVVGEVHSQAGSKRFLIDNMALLKKQKVRVLYLEHFMSDFHQADLNLFSQRGEMPKDLRDYVDSLDRGHGTDPLGRYTFKQVLVAAQRQGIRLRTIDCLASYRQAWTIKPSPVIRQQMMNFHAHLVIAADQLAHGTSRWIALVGSSHANTFEGVPGISELEGAIGLRVQDVPRGQPERIGMDPGRTTIGIDLKSDYTRSDLRLEAALGEPVARQALDVVLANTGEFSFKDVEGTVNLVHRSRDGQLKYTPLHRDVGRYYLERPEWPAISGRRFDNLANMRSALARMGLHYRFV